MVTALQSYQGQVKTLAQAPVPQDDLERKREMDDAWKAYRGKFQPPLKVAPNQPDLNVISNRCSPIVNKGVSFLFGQELKIEAPDQEDRKSTRLNSSHQIISYAVFCLKKKKEYAS